MQVRNHLKGRDEGSGGIGRRISGADKPNVKTACRFDSCPLRLKACEIYILIL